MTEIDRWFRTGAEVPEGLRLLSVYKPNPCLERLVKAAPDRYRDLLVRTLTGIDRRSVAETVSSSRKFREDWPFLGDPLCPAELKILATDKVTAWRAFASAHSELFSAVTPEECLEAAKKCVKFYCQNRKIFSEFAHYKEHGTILGKHPIFDEMKRLQSLRTGGIFSLLGKERNLKDCVWRLRRDIASGDRPDLEAGREQLLESRERELQEVQRMIQEYRDANGNK